MRPIISADNISKYYRLGTRAAAKRTLREVVMEQAGRVFQRKSNRDEQRDLWALNGVSFEVEAGEVVGIIGRNGAGKSTLLKILSRITKPTTGRIELRGRLGSLLEVGTGFHPELTGRENIFLNGAIMGMKRAEIEHKFDEIVEFSEISRFLETPVKHYSSGMYMRLAFAVAAHLEPEILVVDEVLAVGDAQFQRKCLGKMKNVAQSGRTVLFVSHNMAAIDSLCASCILLDHGRVTNIGPTENIVKEYLIANSAHSQGTRELADHPHRTPSSKPIMQMVTIEPDSGIGLVPRSSERLTVRVDFCAQGSAFQPVLGVAVKTLQGMPIFGINNRVIPGYEFATPLHRGSIACHIDSVPLMPGRYSLDLFLGTPHEDVDVIHDAIFFDVESSDVFGSGRLPPPAAGPVLCGATWSLASAEYGTTYDK